MGIIGMREDGDYRDPITLRSGREKLNVMASTFDKHGWRVETYCVADAWVSHGKLTRLFSPSDERSSF